MITETATLSKPERGALVITWDGIVWDAAVARLDDQDGVQLSNRCRGVADNPTAAALAATAAQAAGQRVPAMVVALPQIARRRLEIAVDPRRPLSPTRMGSMAQHQLAESLMALTWTRSVGAALVASGALSVDELCMAIAEQKARRSRYDDIRSFHLQGDNTASDRLGDCAVDLGLCSRADLGRALAQQTLSSLADSNANGDDLLMTGPSLATGWAPCDQDRKERRRHRWGWIMSAMPGNERDNVARVAEEAGCASCHIISLAGAAAGCLDADLNACVIQHHHGILSVTHLSGGKLEREQLVETSGPVPTTDELIEAATGARGAVYLCGDHLDAEAIRNGSDLSAANWHLLTNAKAGAEIGDCEQTDAAEELADEETDPILAGVFRLAAGQGPRGLVACIGEEDAQVSLLWRPLFPIAAGLVLAVGIQLFTIALDSWSEARLEAANKIVSADPIQPISDPANRERVNELKILIADTRTELAFLSTTSNAAGSRSLHCLPQFLAEALNDGVVIDHIASDLINGLCTIYGRATLPQAGAQFRQAMTKLLEPIGWEQDGWQQEGRHGGAFVLNLIAQPLATEEES
jgi:hypothetical protein